MNFMDWLQLAIEILTALTIIIPLGIKLYNTMQEIARTRNWPKLVAKVSDYMAEAEELLEYGADRKTWVMAMIQTTAHTLNYTMTPADIEEISNLIDKLCDMSKVVNGSVPAEVEVEIIREEEV